MSNFPSPECLIKVNFSLVFFGKKTEKELKQLMKISDGLAVVNAERYQDFETPFDLSNAKQAVLAFKGDVYQGMEAESLTADELEFAQAHLRILSGLYGLLRPLDLMQTLSPGNGDSPANRAGKGALQFLGGAAHQPP